MKNFIFIFLIAVCSVFSQENNAEKMNKAIQLYNSNNFEESYKLLRQIVNSPDFTIENLPYANYLLGEINFKTEKYYEALLDFENYLYNFPFDQNVRLALLKSGLIYFHLKDYDNSIKYLTRLRNEFPENTDLGLVEYWLGESFFQMNNLEKAEYYFLESIKNGNTNSEYDQSMYSLAYLYEKINNYDKAEIYYDRLLFESPVSQLTAAAVLRVSRIYFITAKYNKAIITIKNNDISSLTNSEKTELGYILANCLYKVNRFTEASDEFRKVIESQWASTLLRPAQYGLAWSLYQENKIERAHTILSDLREGNDSLAERSQYWSGYFSRYMQKNEQAISEFKKYINLYPIFKYADDARYQIGLIYYLEKRFTESEKYLFMVYDGTDDNEIRANAGLLLGNIYLNRKNFPSAKIYFEAAVSGHKEDTKDFGVAMLSLGIVNFYLNNFETARYILNNLVKRNISDEPDKVYFYLAEANFSLKNFSNSASNYETAIRLTKSDTLRNLSNYGLIYSYFNLKNYDYTIKLIQSYLKKNKNEKIRFELQLRLADSYYAIKEFGLASDIYKNLFSERGTGRSSDYAAYQYAQTLYRAGNINGAHLEFRKFPERYPSSKYVDESMYIVAWISFQKREYDDAVQEYRALINRFPGSPLVPLSHYGIGDAYFNKGDYESALASYNYLITTYRNTPWAIDAVNGIQYCYMAMGRISEAANAISSFVTQNPGQKNLDKLFIKKGDLFMSQRDFSSAIVSYKEFIATFPQSQLIPIAYYSIAKASIQQKNYSEALYNLSIIITNYPSSEISDDARLESGNVYRLMGNFEEAIKRYDVIIKKGNSPLVAEAYYWKAKCYEEMNQYDLASENYNIISSNFGDNTFSSRSRFQIGVIEYNRKNYSTALDNFRQVAGKRNDEFGAESQYLIGKILFEQGQYNEAITEFLRLKSNFSGNLEWVNKGLFSVAESYDKLNDKVKARQYYNELIKSDPKSDLAKEAKKRIGRTK